MTFRKKWWFKIERRWLKNERTHEFNCLVLKIGIANCKYNFSPILCTPKVHLSSFSSEISCVNIRKIKRSLLQSPLNYFLPNGAGTVDVVKHRVHRNFNFARTPPTVIPSRFFPVTASLLSTARNCRSLGSTGVV